MPDSLVSEAKVLPASLLLEELEPGSNLRSNTSRDYEESVIQDNESVSDGFEGAGDVSSPVISIPGSPVSSIGSSSSSSPSDIASESSGSSLHPLDLPDGSETPCFLSFPHEQHNPAESFTPTVSNPPVDKPTSTESLLSTSPAQSFCPSPKSSHMSIIVPALPHASYQKKVPLPISALSRQTGVTPKQQLLLTRRLSMKEADAYLLSDDTEASIAVLQDSLAHLKISPAHRGRGPSSSPYFSRNSPDLRDSPLPVHRLPLSTKNKPRFGPVNLFGEQDDISSPPPSSAPWSQMSSSPQKSFMGPGPSLDLSLIESDRAGSSDSNDWSTLNKRMTGYRIQIKLLKQFIQKLLAAKPNLELPSDLENSFARLDREDSEHEYHKLVHEFSALQETHDDVLELNEQMCANLELFKDQLKQKETLLSQVNQDLEDYRQSLDDLLGYIGSTPQIPSSPVHLGRTTRNELSLEIDAKFQLLSQYLENLGPKQSPHLPSPPESRNRAVTQDKQAHLSTVHELQDKVSALEEELKRHSLTNEALEARLSHELKQAKSFESKHSEMAEKFNELCGHLDPNEADPAIEELKAENHRLTLSNTAASSKFDGCQSTIDQLQLEVNELKRYADKSQQHKCQNCGSQQELADLSLELEKTKAAHSSSIASLMGQLHRQKEQIEQQTSQLRGTEKIRHDMEIAVEKQRVYKSDNIRLGYKAESLVKEKASLQLTVDKLSEQLKENVPSENQEITATLLYDLFEIDVYEFQKLIHSFNKIADDDSLKAPISKINKMSIRLEKLPLRSLNLDDITLLRECHRSVFEYFIRAVDMIVNDHIKMLLQENEEGFSNNEYVKSLRDQVAELLSVNESISRKLDELETQNEAFTSHESIPSPTIERLRILELQTRWKSEREARVYESNQADMRLREVEAENRRLRQVLESV